MPAAAARLQDGWLRGGGLPSSACAGGPPAAGGRRPGLHASDAPGSIMGCPERPVPYVNAVRQCRASSAGHPVSRVHGCRGAGPRTQGRAPAGTPATASRTRKPRSRTPAAAPSARPAVARRAFFDRFVQQTCGISASAAHRRRGSGGIDARDRESAHTPTMRMRTLQAERLYTRHRQCTCQSPVIDLSPHEAARFTASVVRPNGVDACGRRR